MDSLPALRQSLNQLMDLLNSNNTIRRPKDDGSDDLNSQSIVNTAANTVFGIPEILAQLFLCTLSSEVYTTIDPNASPLNISQVCKFWRAVAVGFPPLWASFSLTFVDGRNPDYTTQLFSLLLERSKKLPLSMKLVFGASRGSRSLPEVIHVANKVLLTISQFDFNPLNNLYLVLPPNHVWLIPALLSSQHSNKLRSFAIDIFGIYNKLRTLQDFDLQTVAEYPRLDSLILLNHTISPIPESGLNLASMRQLILVYDFVPGCEAGERTRLNSSQCLRTLRCCPSLENLCVSLHWSAVDPHVLREIRNQCFPVDHDKLKKICIIAGDSYGELDFFLGHLRLPCLHSFEIRSRTTAVLSGGFKSFVEHSATLEEVALYGRNTPAEGILDRLSILPNLKHLTLVQLPHIMSYLRALSHHSTGYIDRLDTKRMCRDLESLTIEEVPGNPLPLVVLSHFIRSRRSFDERTVRGAIKQDIPQGLKLLRVPASQSKELFKFEGVRAGMESGLRIERYEEEHTPTYLSGKDFFHL